MRGVFPVGYAQGQNDGGELMGGGAVIFVMAAPLVV